MVKDTGKTVCINTVKPVNTPKPLYVQENSVGLPVAVKMAKLQVITAIEDKWQIDDEWWRTEPVSRLYYAVLLVSGHRLILYKDLINKRWYCQAS